MTDLEILVKAMEDEIEYIRERFETGLAARNSGTRVVELECWAGVRQSGSRLTVLAADLVAEVTK